MPTATHAPYWPDATDERGDWRASVDDDGKARPTFPARYLSTDVDDDAGKLTTPADVYSYSKANGATPSRGIPEWRRMLGHFETRVTRSSKGRRSFIVTGAHQAVLVGPDPFRDVSDLVAIDGVTLALMADSWARHNGCDDFPALIGTEANGRAYAQVIHAGVGAVDTYGIARHRADITDGLAGLPRHMISEARLHAVYGAETNEHGEAQAGGRRQAAETARMPVRYSLTRLYTRKGDPCATRTFHGSPEDGPAGVPLSEGCEGPVLGASTVRLLAPAETPAHLFCGHDRYLRGAPRSGVKASRVGKITAPIAREMGPEETTISAAIAETPAGETVSIELPDVAIRVTVNAGSPMSVRMTRGGETITFRARTASVIARRAIA